MKGQQETTCSNCGHNVHETYCSHCGQKNRPTLLTLQTIFGEFFAILFNLDNQFFYTIKTAVIPGLLATNFEQGKRKRQLHPLRFFFYSWLLFTLFLNGQNNDLPSSSESPQDFFFKKLKEKQKNQKADDIIQIDITKHDMDSLLANNDFALSVMNFNYLFTSDSTKITPPTDTLTTILWDDFNNMSKDSLFAKYQVTDWKHKLFLVRAGRLQEGWTDGIYFLQKHVIWLIFAVIPFSALWLYLLFGRTKRNYAQHVSYLLYLFAVLFILGSIMMALSYLPEQFQTAQITILVLLTWIYSFFSLKNYYGQGWTKTFFKWNVYLFGNMFFFIVFSILYTLVSILLF